jgi:outer membrane protein OmpA-like peptidoglycan-associated protein
LIDLEGVMIKFNSLLLALVISGTGCLLFADDSGTVPGYVYTPASGDSVVKTAYGQCLHNAYWQPAYGLDQCGEAPKVTTKKYVTRVMFSESGVNLFAFDSADLSAAGKKELAGLVSHARGEGELETLTKVIVTGHTDKIGTEEENQELSVARATSVKDFLVSLGIPSGKITATGMGYQNSLVSDACFKRYNISNEAINKAAAVAENAATPAEAKRLNDAFNNKYAGLVKCTSADRRVEIVVEQTETEAVTE